MKIIKKERTGNTVIIDVEIEYSSFKTAEENALLEASKHVKLPGFRPGKAPKAMIEKALDPKAIEERAAQDLIGKAYPQIIKEAQIDPVDYPNINIQSLEKDKPFVFTLTVEVYPEVKLGKHKGLKAEKKSTAVTEEETLKVLGNLQNRFAKRIEVADRGIVEGDYVDLEVEADAAGVAIKRWPRKLQSLPVGGGYISPDFDKQISGLKAGETKEFKISFPSDYLVAEVAGKEVSFKVKIDKIEGQEFLPLDDEFAKSVSRFGTMAELKEEIKKSLEMEKKEEAEADLKNKLIEEILKDTTLEVPHAMINYETELMIDELKTSLARSNLTLEAYLHGIKKNEDELKEELKPPATQRAKSKVVLKKIAEAENIVVAPQDIDQEIRLMAQSSDKSEEEYKRELGEGGLHYIKDYLLRRKALDFVVENAQIKEEKQ